ncbi:MAG: tetratricopeptide repeat protein [Candidatus Polarisedimenticolia bacterium]
MTSRLLCRMLVAVILASGASACVTRQSVDVFRRDIERLQKENFELRKNLAEARVRAQMQAEGRAAPGPEKNAPAEATELPLPASGGRQDSSSGIIYSEPITDASRYTSGPLTARPASSSRSGGGAHPAAVGSASTLMEEARRLLDDRKPQQALELFQQVVTGHSDDALADDAQFGVGECAFQMERYEEAMAAYRVVAERFPFGDQVPAAMLKIGFSRLALNQRDEALEVFKNVSATYPGTEAATVARQQIAHLKAKAR